MSEDFTGEGKFDPFKLIIRVKELANELKNLAERSAQHEANDEKRFEKMEELMNSLAVSLDEFKALIRDEEYQRQLQAERDKAANLLAEVKAQAQTKEQQAFLKGGLKMWQVVFGAVTGTAGLLLTGLKIAGYLK